MPSIFFRLVPNLRVLALTAACIDLSCFRGTAGLPCSSDSECDEMACQEGICGGGGGSSVTMVTTVTTVTTLTTATTSESDATAMSASVPTSGSGVSMTGDDDGTAGTETTMAPPAVCGDGIVEGDEPCDDGNDESNDGCNASCERMDVPLWTRTWDSGAKHDEGAFGVAFDAEGNIYVAGIVEFINDEDTAVVRKITSEGEELLQYIHTGQFGFGSGGRQVAVGADGSVFMVGYERIVAGGHSGAFARRFAANATPGWSFSRQSDILGGSGEITDIAVHGDEIFVVGTETVAQDKDDIFIHRLASNDGSVAWTATIPDSTGGFSGIAREYTSGDVVIASSTLDDLDEAIPVVGRYTANGKTLWVKYYGGRGQGVARDVATTADGNIIITGYLDGDAWTALLDPNGNVIWEDEYNYGGALAMGVAPAPNGGAYIGGFIGSGPPFARRYTAKGNPYWTSIPDVAPDTAIYAIAANGVMVVVVGNTVGRSSGADQWLRAYSL